MAVFRNIILLFVLSTAYMLVGCSDKSNVHSKDFVPAPETSEISYRDDIEPIIETKCLACHGCYDAPCQLKFENPDGLLRGAHKKDVHNGGRLKNATPTRLGIDAQTEEEWREHGFWSVLEEQQRNQPVLRQMIKLGKQHEFEPNSRLPKKIKLGLERNHQCVNPKQFAVYARKHPFEGMPLGTAGLTNEEYALFTGWIDQGAKVDEREIELSEAEEDAVKEWEDWFNRSSKKQQHVARWVYEHLYLARLHFDDLEDSENYFEVIRSRTPSGEEPEIVGTTRPNDDPAGEFYYRLRPVDETIVHKRHITYPLSSEKLEHYEELFFDGEDWDLDELPGYSSKEKANPFVTFAAIPARARYQFMLDNAEYFTRTFIRGPVCRGQIATDVIRDHFWAVFMDPDKDAFIIDEEHREAASPLLGLAGQNNKLIQAGKEWRSYKKQRNQYLAEREKTYQEIQPEGPSLDDVWDGDGHNQDALLTIFRHHDSASVEKGWIGDVPTTIWWMDYPLFERTYYQLVVNFDVFGNVAHQLQTRLYFDLIRNGSEQAFLRLMPADSRQELLDSWYRKLGKIKLAISYQKIDTEFPTAEEFTTKEPKEELASRVLERFKDLNAMANDPINRCSGDECGREVVPGWINKADKKLSTIASTSFKDHKGLKRLPEVTFLRVTNGNERTVYTLIRNRYHSNVAFLMGEKRRYKAKNDTLTVYPGIIGSYPNFIFSVEHDELGEFIDRLEPKLKKKEFREIAYQWGIRRTHPDFWNILHDITDWHREHDPLQAGIFDINRYENL